MKKRGQEEMIGFVIIVVIVAVILLVFLRFSLNNDVVSENNFEVETFLQVYLEYTTDCSNLEERLTMRNLIVACNKDEECTDGIDACEVLEKETEEILKRVWQDLKPDTVGYSLLITTETSQIFDTGLVGNSTNNYKSGMTTLTGKGIDIFMNVYK